MMTIFSISDYTADSNTQEHDQILHLSAGSESKSQKSVTLSLSKAEFVALSEAVKEIKFIVQVLESIVVKANFLIIMQVDNVGAIFMVENVTNNQWTKHMDIWYHFVQEFVKDRYIKIIFVKTAENCVDMFTKNSYDFYCAIYMPTFSPNSHVLIIN